MEGEKYIAALESARSFLQARKPDFSPEILVILGSGLSLAVPDLKDSTALDYARIPGFPRATVFGHAGRLHLGRRLGTNVAVMQGRFHYYEGHSLREIAFPLRVLNAWGLKAVLATAAVGSLRRQSRPGDLVLIRDHLNWMGDNPLRGVHHEAFGAMFPDLNRAYDESLRRRMAACLRRRKTPFRQGVYVAVSGPSYETPAEVKAYRFLGGDVIGMSVVPEIIVSRQMGLRCAALTWVSNWAGGMAEASLSHPDVLKLGARIAPILKNAIEDFIDAGGPGEAAAEKKA